MNVASFENCKQLYEVSKWESDWMYWKLFMGNNGDAVILCSGVITTGNSTKICCSYDCGYLLRMLPRSFEGKVDSLGNFGYVTNLFVEAVDNDRWQAYYRGTVFLQEADAAEDALCLLAIELFKQGVLKK